MVQVTKTGGELPETIHREPRPMRFPGTRSTIARPQGRPARKRSKSGCGFHYRWNAVIRENPFHPQPGRSIRILHCPIHGLEAIVTQVSRSPRPVDRRLRMLVDGFGRGVGTHFLLPFSNARIRSSGTTPCPCKEQGKNQTEPTDRLPHTYLLPARRLRAPPSTP